jgi:hypothetical protein
MTLGAITVGTVLLAIGILVMSVTITLGVYYLVSGDWLWEREKKDGRNWSPPR